MALESPKLGPSAVRTLTLSDEGYKNLDILAEDGRIVYTVQTVKKGGAFSSTSTSTTISRVTRGSSNSLNDAVAYIEWGKKTTEPMISYKGKKTELRELLPPKEWQYVTPFPSPGANTDGMILFFTLFSSRKVLTLSGTWKWTIQGEDPPEVSTSPLQNL